jgi:phage tail-like protein
MAKPAQIIVQFQGQVVFTTALEDVLTVGRSGDNNLPLGLPGVSRKHAEIRLTPAGPVIVDLNSEKGTFVAGNKLEPDRPYPLLPGLPIQIGPYVLSYEPGEGSPNVKEAEALSPEELEPEVPEEPYVAPAALPPLPPALVRYAAPRAQGPAALYMRDLPAIFHNQEFLHRFLMIFESIWEPLEWRQDHIDLYFDPRTAPLELLTWMASWLGFPAPAHWPEARRRKVLLEAMELVRWRGTTYGLTRAIELCTGFMPIIENDPKQPYVFNVRINPPEGVTPPIDLLNELILLHKPGPCAFTLEIGGQPKKSRKKAAAT